MTPSSCLTFPKYRDYYEEIRVDDADSVQARITLAAFEDKKVKLLHGRFQFTTDQSDLQLVKRCLFTRPFLLAAAFGSIKTCDVMMESDVSVLFDVEDDMTTTAGLTPLNFVHCLVVVAVYEPQLESLMVDTFKHLSRHLSVDAARQLLHQENGQGLRPLEFASLQGTILLLAAILDTPDVYLVRDEVIDTMVYRWYDVTEYESHWTESAAGVITKETGDITLNLNADDRGMELTERRQVSWLATSDSTIKLDLDRDVDSDLVQEKDNDKVQSSTLVRTRLTSKHSKQANKVSPAAVPRADGLCTATNKKNEKEMRVVNAVSRKHKSPLFFLLSLDTRHAEVANRLLCEGRSPLCHWMERTISCQKNAYIATFFLRLIYTLIIFIFEMDERWIINIGGISNSTFQTGNDLLGRDLTSTPMPLQNSPFVYCAQFSSIHLSAFWITVIGAYLVLHSMIYICTPFLKSFVFFCRSRTAALNRQLKWDLKGRRRLIVGRARLSDRCFSAICGLCVIIEVALLPCIHTRGDSLIAIDILRLFITITSLWNLMLYLQIFPIIGHIIIFIRGMSSDLLAFLFLFMFFVTVFARQFMLFFNVNSQQDCVQDFSSFPITLYNLYLAMLNTLDFTQYRVYDQEILYLNHFAFVLMVGILLLNLLIAVFTNTIAHAKRNKEIIICLTRLCVIIHKDYLVAHLPFVDRFYYKLSSWEIKRGFVCEGGKVYLVCSSPLDHKS